MNDRRFYFQNGDFSYHRVMFEDFDGDGDQDAITARFQVGIFGET
jgi:hypothetical protein